MGASGVILRFALHACPEAISLQTGFIKPDTKECPTEYRYVISVIFNRKDCAYNPRLQARVLSLVNTWEPPRELGCIYSIHLSLLFLELLARVWKSDITVS